jgi:hypothetical protein
MALLNLALESIALPRYVERAATRDTTRASE